MEFGARLKGILESKGMTQADLSRFSSIGEDHISKLINGKTNPAKKTLEKLSEAFPTRSGGSKERQI